MSGNRFAVLAALSLALSSGAVPASKAADNYAIDPAHTSVYFKIPHMGLSWTYGRFNDVGGKFTVDADVPAKTGFGLTIKTESVDTANPKRDEHLRSPDFLNAKQFPAISFSSTHVKPIDGGYEVQGDFTMHGVTKPISFVLKGGKTAEFPPGMQRTGFSTELMIHRSDFGMDKMLEAVGDEIKVAISFEGVKKYSASEKRSAGELPCPIPFAWRARWRPPRLWPCWCRWSGAGCGRSAKGTRRQPVRFWEWRPDFMSAVGYWGCGRTGRPARIRIGCCWS